MDVLFLFIRPYFFGAVFGLSVAALMDLFVPRLVVVERARTRTIYQPEKPARDTTCYECSNDADGFRLPPG